MTAISTPQHTKAKGIILRINKSLESEKLLRTNAHYPVQKSERSMTAEVLMATPSTKSLGCESGGHKHGGDGAQALLENRHRFLGVTASILMMWRLWRQHARWRSGSS